jgi:long-chain fatty acid transport protein
MRATRLVRRSAVVAGALCGAVSTMPTLGAGFALIEQSGSGMGNAYAGVSAAAEDASTVYWNPAGMARLAPGKHAAVAIHSINPSVQFFNGNSQAGINRTDFGTDGGQAGQMAYLPNAYFVMPVNPDVSFGLGINSPFGLATEYEATWSGRFQGIKSDIKTVNINPGVSWKANDQLAVGFGLNWQRGNIDLVTAVNYKGLVFGTALNAAVPANAEGENRTSVDGDAWGYNFGAIYDFTPATRLGIAYRSKLNYTLEGTTTFNNVPAAFALSPALTAGTANGKVSLKVTTPDTWSASLVHKLDQRIDLLADMTWTGWSAIKQLPLMRDTGATQDTLRFNFVDTMRYSVGANYRSSNAWTWKAGLALDQTPVSSEQDRTVRLPDANRVWYSVGAKYRPSRESAVDVGYSYIHVKDAAIDNNQNVGNVRGDVNGRYQEHINIVSVQYSLMF